MIPAGEYLRSPLGFMRAARLTISINGAGTRWSSALMRSQMSVNSSTSHRFDERSGYRLKWGSIRDRRRAQLRTSHLSV
jgi:hypothetical protein